MTCCQAQTCGGYHFISLLLKKYFKMLIFLSNETKHSVDGSCSCDIFSSIVTLQNFLGDTSDFYKFKR